MLVFRNYKATLRNEKMMRLPFAEKLFFEDSTLTSTFMGLFDWPCFSDFKQFNSYYLHKTGDLIFLLQTVLDVLFGSSQFELICICCSLLGFDFDLHQILNKDHSKACTLEDDLSTTIPFLIFLLVNLEPHRHV